MRKSLIFGPVLTFGIVLAACAQQAPAGYVSLDDVEIEKSMATPVAAKSATAEPAPAAPTVAAIAPVVAPEAPAPLAEVAKAVQLPASPPLAEAAVAAPAPVALAPVLPAAPMFEAKLGASLRDTLDKWAGQAGWGKVSWKLPEDLDFTLGVADKNEGDFMVATRALVSALGCEAELRVLFNPTTKVALVEPV